MSKQLAGEISANFVAFEEAWPKELLGAQTASKKQIKIFEESFKRIASIQSWRSMIVSQTFSADSEAFFFEGQNDLLISHCLARCGSFRQSLKSLRSAIENLFFALYYSDHAIELENWKLGRHRISFTELFNYFEVHPRLYGSDPDRNGLSSLKNEYSTLSKAVHASAVQFRMTQKIEEIRLWSDDVAELGKWSTREREVISAANLLLIHLFKDRLTGAQLLGLRAVLGLCLNAKQRAYAKSELNITIPPAN